jgi:hypothetical protein
MASSESIGRHDVKFIEMLYNYLPRHYGPLKRLKKMAADGALDRGALAEIALAMAANGKWKRTSVDGADCSDGSDIKTVTIKIKRNLKNGVLYESPALAISNLQNKGGDLRVIAYDSLMDTFRYFYIFKYDVSNQNNANRGAISISLATNRSKYINGECGYECKSFEELARA